MTDQIPDQPPLSISPSGAAKIHVELVIDVKSRADTK